jgi:hypothetical protein
MLTCALVKIRPEFTSAATDHRDMLKLDHLTVIAPTLQTASRTFKTCLDLNVSFGQRHSYTLRRPEQ